MAADPPEDFDQGAYEAALAAETAKGTDARVAEGRARRAGVRAYRKVHGEHESTPAPAAAAAGNGEAAAVTAPAPVAAAVGGGGGGPAPAAPRSAPPPTGKPPTSAKPGGPDKHRLLALVAPEGIQAVERDQGDRVNVWPHLLGQELVAALVLSAFLTIYSTFLNAPLRELANPNLTPNPSKAPWYFLGLQELLRYFHPVVAGITIPTFILVGLGAVPFIDRNPSTKPGDRKLAITLFTILFMFGATLTIIGCFFRGPGYNWVWPWSQGIFFDL